MSRHANRIEAADIMLMEAYGAARQQLRRDMIERKRLRRVAVGPDVTFYFENYHTMWMQVHEMLFTEKGGDAQLADELAAYNPLIPNGRELVATMMIEITDERRRRATLARLGGIEKQITITVGDDAIRARAEQDVERTTADGRTSSVHFLHFPFTESLIAGFGEPGARTVLAIDHAEYRHMAIIPEPVRKQLADDFD
ncbi:MAG: DUF3501 family protein [Sphingomonadales bacterium]